jgi:hypothetical protein
LVAHRFRNRGMPVPGLRRPAGFCRSPAVVPILNSGVHARMSLTGAWPGACDCQARPRCVVLMQALQGSANLSSNRTSAVYHSCLIRFRQTVSHADRMPSRAAAVVRSLIHLHVKVKESSRAILVRASTTRRSGRDTGHTFSKQRGSAYSVTNGGQESGDYPRT